jgi:hypothetical protein
VSFFRLPFFLLALLAACAPPGDPRAPVQLMVPPSPSTYLPSAAKHSYSQMVAAALRQRQVDAVADHAHWGDWRLALRVTHSWGSDTATPVFTITDPSGHDLPDVETAPVRFDVWKQARPEILRRAAEEAAPRLATLLREERAARIQRARKCVPRKSVPRRREHRKRGRQHAARRQPPRG